MTGLDWDGPNMESISPAQLAVILDHSEQGTVRHSTCLTVLHSVVQGNNVFNSSINAVNMTLSCNSHPAMLLLAL